MQTRELAAGENTPLPATWRLTVTPAVPLLMVALDAADHVHGEPIPVVASALPMNLGALESSVQRCLLVAHGRRLPAATSELDLGESTLVVRSAAPGEAPATVLLECYRRAGGWKVRALGQHYAGGLPELGRVHGAMLTDAAGLAPAGPSNLDSAAGVSAGFGAGASTVDSSAGESTVQHDPETIQRHLNGIWEDASRSLVAYAESMAFADERRDNELGALLADPTRRSAGGPADGSADPDRSAIVDTQRAAVEARHGQIADLAARRRLDDLDQLVGELTALETTFPAPVAGWGAPVWQQPIGPDGVGIFRIGTLTRPDSQALRIPMVHHVSALGGICLENPAGVVDQAVRGLLHRILAAVPAGTEVAVVADDDQLAGFLGLPAPARRPDQNPLAELARQVDLHLMAAEAGAMADLPGALPGVVIVPWPALGFGAAEVAALDRIGVDGALLGLRLVLLASRNQLAGLGLRQQPRYLPVVAASVKDPWTGILWEFEPDEGTADAAVAQRISQRTGRPG
ncbi:TerD family protein [Nakamurella lactea]|uniref:TerD family protein n=1 Tax=Nakamurella lactea TaxID=459515 RepID=UPI000425D004|nr:TerD family protein [Nakamurella lactea]